MHKTSKVWSDTADTSRTWAMEENRLPAGKANLNVMSQDQNPRGWNIVFSTAGSGFPVHPEMKCSELLTNSGSTVIQSP